MQIRYFFLYINLQINYYCLRHGFEMFIDLFLSHLCLIWSLVITKVQIEIKKKSKTNKSIQNTIKATQLSLETN